MAVLAKHTITGLLALVNEDHLAQDSHLVLATKGDIADERKRREQALAGPAAKAPEKTLDPKDGTTKADKTVLEGA